MSFSAKIICKTLAALTCFALMACMPTHHASWHLALSHDSDGNVMEGDMEKVVNAVRNGCDLRIAWGARRAADPTSTIEHIADPLWVSVRNSSSVEAQIGNFMANQTVLGEPNSDHPRRERFGGTETAVMWRALLKTDGTFDAIWYDGVSGELEQRIPQRHPMKWYADCPDRPSTPLFPTIKPETE